MLRASSFCRRRIEKGHEVRLELDHKNEDIFALCCWAEWTFLQAASLVHGSYVWIECHQRRLALKIFCYDKESRREQGDVADAAVPVLTISALAAANLHMNVCPFCESQMVARLSPCRNEIQRAESVHLRMYAGPVMDPRTSENREDSTTGNSTCQDDWPLPTTEMLLQRKAIIALKTKENVDMFYQVLCINEDSEFGDELFGSTPSTRYTLEEPPFSSCPALPPLSSHLPPHPSLHQLANCLQNARPSRTAECVFHVIGTDAQHHVDTLIQSVAASLGRRCIQLPRGWAAFAYRADGRLLSNGGLIDKLNGLQAALVLAKRSIPSVLHVCFDATEFSAHDDEQYDDEQSRIWSMLMKQLAFVNHQTITDNLVPPLIILLSTSTVLQPGPLKESLVFEPLQVATPDAEYIEYLWKDVSVTLTDQVLDVLKGRPVNQILELRKQFLRASKTSPSSLSTTHDRSAHSRLLQSLARDLDARQRTTVSRIPQVCWSDVGGLHSVRREILDTIQLPLQHPHLFSSRRTGILLYGPPGTGKTLVAKAVATECSLPFLSIKGPELLGSYVGESEENVRAIFTQARILARNNQTPACILFFDELDSLAPRRGDQASGGGNVMDRVVATLLAELERKVRDGTVYCLGATNRPDLLDPAMLRPGRFDRLVYLGMASPDDQAKILMAQMRTLRVEGDIADISRMIVNQLPNNLSGADLSMLVSKALVRATERLCDQADVELMKCKRDGITLEHVLTGWDNQNLVPIVTLDDLLIAAFSVNPSVSFDDLKEYEKLKGQFQMSAE